MYKWKRRCSQKSSKLASILTSHPSRPAELTQPKKTAWQKIFRKYFAGALNIVRLPPPLWWLGGLRGWSGVEEGSGSNPAADVIPTSHDSTAAQNSMKATFRKSRGYWHQCGRLDVEQTIWSFLLQIETCSCHKLPTVQLWVGAPSS